MAFFVAIVNLGLMIQGTNPCLLYSVKGVAQLDLTARLLGPRCGDLLRQNLCLATMLTSVQADLNNYCVNICDALIVCIWRLLLSDKFTNGDIRLYRYVHAVFMSNNNNKKISELTINSRDQLV